MRSTKRLTVTLDRRQYALLKDAAHAAGVSLSRKTRDLLKLAMDSQEDAYWVKAGEGRLASFRDSEALTHEEAWGVPPR
jgi:hypothetical protein